MVILAGGWQSRDKTASVKTRGYVKVRAAQSQASAPKRQPTKAQRKRFPGLLYTYPRRASCRLIEFRAGKQIGQLRLKQSLANGRWLPSPTREVRLGTADDSRLVRLA
jgi:hypothetical protein